MATHPENNWGFTYYKPTFRSDGKLSQYRAKFVRPKHEGTSMEAWVDFYSNQPLRSLRLMVERLRDGTIAHPRTFDNQRFLPAPNNKVVMA